MSESKAKRLGDLRNIGKAMLADFDRLGVKNVEQLAACDPAELYDRLQVITGGRQDPCVLDTFTAAVHEARTGEKIDWWQFSRARKAGANQTS
jgi:hypothetical protein